MYNKEAFDNTHSHDLRHRGGCKGNFRFGEAFANGFRGAPWGERMRRRMSGRPSVNITETDEHYLLSLYAAGLTKDSFSISVREDVLTISYEPKTEDSGAERYIHEEHRTAPFKRSFLLNGRVQPEEISASYTDGVLRVTLPKSPEARQPAQEIIVE